MCSMVGIDGDRGALGGALGGADVGNLLLVFGEVCMKRFLWVVVITAVLVAGGMASAATRCQWVCYWSGGAQNCQWVCQ